MVRPEKANWLDKAIAQTAPGLAPEPDFDAWQRRHAHALETLTQRAQRTTRHDGPLPAVIAFGRELMKPSPVKLAVAAAILIVALAGIYFLGGTIDGTSKAFAVICENVNQTNTVQFTVRSEIFTGRVYEKDGYLVRSEFQSSQPAPFDTVLMDKRAGNYLYMDSKRKIAWHPNVEFSHVGSSIYELFTNYRNMPGYSVTTLGEKRIGSQLAAGFRLATSMPNMEPVQYDIWTDPETKLPIQINTAAASPQGELIEQTITDIEFDKPLPDALFDFAPEGYEIVAPADVNAPPSEREPVTETTPTPEEPAEPSAIPAAPAAEPTDTDVPPVPTPEPQMSVAGIIVDKLTQQPIEGAMVWHTLRDPNGAARGDEQGRFVLTGALPHGQTYLYVVAPGYVSQRMLTGTATENIRFELDPASRVAGIVTNAKGTPVTGATVKTFHFTNRPVLTDEDGHFEIDGLNPVAQGYSLHVTHPDYPAVAVRFAPAPVGQTVRQDVILQPGVDVYGTVTDDQGRPVEGVTVGNTRSGAMWNCITDETDHEGNYLLKNVDLGELVLWAVHPDHAMHAEHSTLPPGQDSVRMDIRLEPPVPLRIRVVDYADEPIPDVMVVVHEYNGVSNLTEERPTTDADGWVVIPNGAAEGTIRLNPFGKGISSELQEFELGQDEYIVRVYRAGRVYGEVVSATTHEPITEFTVKMTFSQVAKSPSGYSAVWNREGVAFESSQGLFDTGREDLPIGGSYRLTVLADGYDPLTLDPVQVQPISPTPDRARFELLDATLLPGQVVNAQGQPIENAMVALFSQKEQYEPRYWRTFTTDAQGIFVIAGMAKEQRYVYVTAPGYAPYYGNRTALETGNDTPVRIVLTEGVTVFGTVVDHQGHPRVGLTVRIIKASDVQTGADYPRLTSDASSTTDPNGYYELSGISPGICDVRLSDSGNNTLAVKSVELEAGQPTQVDFGNENGFVVTGVLRRGPAPIGEADISIRLADGDRRHAQTDAQGHFSFHGIAAGQHRLQIEWSEDASWQSNGRTSIEERSVEIEGDTDLDFDLGDGVVSALIPPSVRDHEGLAVSVRQWTEIPPTDAATTHWKNDHQANRASEIRSDGRFVCDKLRPGQYYLVLRDKDRVLGITDVFEMGASDRRDDIVFRMGQGKLSIQVVDALTTQPIARARYMIENDLEWPFYDKRLTVQSSSDTMRTDARGRALFEELPRGQYQVSCQAEGYLWATSAFVAVDDGHVTQVTVALEPAAMASFKLSERLRSRVDTDSVFIYCKATDLDTQTIVPMRFGSYRSQQHTVRFSLETPDGNVWSLLHLPAGRYQLDYEVRPYNTARNTVEMGVYKGTVTAELTTGQVTVVDLDD